YLTDFGKILLARTERLFDFIRQGLRRLLGGHPSSEPVDIDTLTGKITTTHISCLIAVSENMSFDQAARSIGVSQPSMHRAARVQIVEEPYEQLLDHLRAGNIDVLFSVLRRPAWATDVTETMLFEEPYVIVMRPKHPLSAFADIGRDQLADYDWIVPGPSTP